MHIGQIGQVVHAEIGKVFREFSQTQIREPLKERLASLGVNDARGATREREEKGTGEAHERASDPTS